MNAFKEFKNEPFKILQHEKLCSGNEKHIFQKKNKKLIEELSFLNAIFIPTQLII